ncbi:MAG: hypothetical protein ABIG45_09300, partial [Bacillota bacterium]
SLMTPKIHSLTLFMQFHVSMYSPSSNQLFTDVIPKNPYTYSATEWKLVTLDANVGGWGILFSGIFLISLAIIFRAIYVMSKRKSRKVKFLIVTLLIIFLPVFFIPYLFSARYYLQLFWLPLAAMICLFIPSSDTDLRGHSAAEGKKPSVRLLGVVLCLLLIFNCVTGYNYLNMQVNETRASREIIRRVIDETENNGKVMDITPQLRGLFYGLVFNLQDEGVRKYNFLEHIPDSEIEGNVLYYLVYRLRDDGGDAYADTNSFLSALNSNGYLVIIAKQGASGALTERMKALMDLMALRADAHDSLTENYLAVIDTNAHVRTEESGAEVLLAQVTADKLPVQVQSAIGGASIMIDGTEYALKRNGYNIVVYDPVNMALVDSVVINPDIEPALSR